jgi:glycosyltransferase involved in cell wall biosynthesis
MKILEFSPYYPPHIGGLESHADEFNKYLSQKGVDITVFTPRLPKDAPALETKYDGTKIIRFPAFEIIPTYPLPQFWNLHFWRLFYGLFKKDIDIVVSRTRFFATSIMALKYAKLKRKRWLHIEHGSDFVKLTNKFYSFTARIYDYTLGKIILNFCDRLVANSQASADFCRKLAPKKPCEVIYRGVEIEKIENIVPNLELKNKYKDEFIIAFLGRLISGKGVSDLISAVKDIDSGFILLIIGDGPERKNLEALAKKLNLENKVMFFGNKKFEDAISIIKISDLVVNPSYTEGLPTSVIEASICQKAIIATNVGGTPEIITDEKSGFLIEPKNITVLKKKIINLINDNELREKFGANAYQEVRNKFNWSESVKKYLKIFDDLLQT